MLTVYFTNDQSATVFVKRGEADRTAQRIADERYLTVDRWTWREVEES